MNQTEKIFHELNILHALIRARLFHYAENLPLHPHQLPMLETILRFPGITQAEAAAKLHVTPASIALSTKRLAAAGMIEKQSDPDSRRKNRLIATPLGRETAIQARKHAKEASIEMLQGFSEEEVQCLSQFLCRMLSNLAPDAIKSGFPFLDEEETILS